MPTQFDDHGLLSRKRRARRAALLVVLPLLLLATLFAGTARASRVQSISPQGDVAEVRQVLVRFDSAVVAAGDLRAAPPYELACDGVAPAGSARWLNDRSWAYDLQTPLAAGVLCTLTLRADFKPLDGQPLQAPRGLREARFSSGAPVVLAVQPYPGTAIEEDGHFLLSLNGPVDLDSVLAHVWCEVDGLGERIAVKNVDGLPLAQVLKQQGGQRGSGTRLLLACTRAFAAGSKVRLVWGAGVTAAGRPQLASTRERRWSWPVRQRFTAEFSCERENAAAPCLPLRPMTLRFNAPVPRAQALAVRLQPEQGAAIAPLAEDEARSATVQALRFAAPLAESTRFRITLPAALRDDTGRPLANAADFPLAVATGGMPPLAKFAGAPFGLLEAGSDAANPPLLPLTLRHVQADLAGASTGGQVRIKRLDAGNSDLELLRWIARLRRDHDDRLGREQPMLAAEPDARRADLPQLSGSAPRATEVIGIPLPQRGYHVVEVESRILGAALLASQAPMYARTGVLVSGLGVHFKSGRTSSLVWVTTLERGRPVAGARVAVNDCQGAPLWSGSTDAAGIARIPRGFDNQRWDNPRCANSEGLFVTARSGAAGSEDLAFVFSGWNQGIEAWRFNLPTAQGTQPDSRAHTVFDRTLLRVGDSVSMKHFLRLETAGGLALPDADALPTELLLTHQGSGAEVRLPLAWPRGARSAESRWLIPATAALGGYDVTLMRANRRWFSGSFRVEAFRVPLVDARLNGPSGVLVAPASLNFAAQLNALAGGPMAAAPLQLSALLRRAPVSFKGYEDFSFEPAGPARGAEGEDGDEGRETQKLVADKLQARTDGQGAARIAVAKMPALAGPSELLAELGYTDPNGEAQTVAQRLKLWPAAVVAGLRVPGWAAARGQAGVTAVVLSTDGLPLKDRAVEVSGRLQQTISTRKRIVGGFYSYDNRRETRELGPLCSGKTDAQGRLSCELALDVVGEVELIVRAKDDAGRVAQAASSVWLSGPGEWWFAQGNDDRIDVLPEKRELMPGETARLQVRMPFRQATALVTVEREGVIDSRVMTLSGREPVIELPIPRAAKDGASWAPNVVVSVLVLRGRLREAPWWSVFTWGWREPAEWWQAFRYEGRDWRAPSGLVDLAKPAYKLGAAALSVGLADHRLDVQVLPEKTQYGVRETVKTTVRVRFQGQPVAGAELAFAAVDEGLLALQPNHSWDLLQALFQPRPWGVETATAQGQVIGRRHFGRKALPPGGGGGRSATRELFDTLLLWRGSVVLDARGEAQIDVPLNDSLTGFRLVAIADAGAGRYGTGSASVRVTQDLQMLSGLPPLAREGDRLDATFTLRNTTPRAMTVQARLAGKADGAAAPIDVSAPTQTVALAPGAAQTLRWTVKVPAGAIRIDWEADAVETTGEAPARDRLKVVQSVQPAVPVRVWQASLQQLGTPVLRLAMQRPADALPGAGGVRVTLQPRLGGALPGLRRYFETYPYNCLEQRSSRALALHDAPGWQRLQAELPGYLDADGLASYYPVTAGSAPHGSDRLTAYLIASAHEAGQAWPDAARDAMLRGLTAFVEGRLDRRYPSPRPDLDVRKLAALEALARHGRVQPRLLDAIAWAPAAWPTSALLDAWSLYRQVPTLPGREARIDELQRLVRSRLVAGGTTLAFSTEASDDWWWLMDGPDSNAARLLLAAADSPAWQSELPQLVTGALARQRRGAWQTTTANLWGVLALERFSAKAEAVPVAGRSTVQWAATTRTQDWSAQAEGSTQALPWPVADASATTTLPPLTAQHQGAGKPWLTLQVLAAVPLRAPLAAGYRVTRSVSAIERRQPDAWTRGDTLRVKLEIDALADMAFVVVSDPVPTGATLLGSGLGSDSLIATQGEQRSGAWPAYIERAAEAWRGHYEWLPRGHHVVEYTLRLNASGQFHLPPTRVEAMYAPETFGEAPNAVLEVRP